MSCNVICGDLTKVEADAIVFSANPQPICGEGLDRAIYEAAGHNELFAERIRIGSINVGEAKATPAFNLKAKYLIHTVAPIWTEHENNSYVDVKNCYENSFNLALELGCKSVATGLIATGINGFPKDKVIKLLIETAGKYNQEFDLDVTIVVYEGEDAFDDERYRLVREHILKSLRGEVSLLERNTELERALRNKNYKSMNSVRNSKKSTVDVGSLLLAAEETFQQRVIRLVEERKEKPSKIYGAADIKKQTFSKILLDEDYHPNKYTAVALCLAFELDLMDSLDLIESAGWTLSKSNKMDLVVRACIINRIYSINAVNKLLKENGLEELKNIK